MSDCKVRYACDIRVLRERGFNNTVSQLQKKLRKQHTQEWSRRVLQYLTACEPSATGSLTAPVTFAPPPDRPSLPNPTWFLSVYVRDVLHCLQDIWSRITSTFRTILKMDSIKKVCALCRCYSVIALYIHISCTTDADHHHETLYMS